MVLHILTKDLRHHRWEIALYVLACAAWTWQTANPLESDWLRQKGLVPLLLFGMWFILVIRAVQGEPLVGDREFWMTRPYRWGELMTEKALFLILCLNVPMLIAESVLLRHAHVPFTIAVCGGLLFLQLEFAFFLTIPVAALAAVTESLVQWGLFVAGIVVYVLVLTWLPWDKLPPGLEGGENLCATLGMAITAPVLAFVLIWQYARRRVWPARLAFAGALLYIPLVIFLSGTSLIRSFAYPRSKIQAPLQLSFAQDESGSRSYSRSTGAPVAGIHIPVIASTADPDTLIEVDGMQITLTGDKGWHWQSQWISHSVNFSKDSPDASINFILSGKLADELRQVHASASVELAYGVYRMGKSQQVRTDAAQFELPGAIYCNWGSATVNGLFMVGPPCVAPLHLPEAIEVRIDSGDNTCRQADDEDSRLDAGHFASDVEYGTSLPADFDPDPLHKLNLSMGSWIPPISSKHDPNVNRRPQICRGTPLTARTGVLENKMRATYDLGNIGTERRVEAQIENE